jgi:hypothetical protein
MSFDERRLPQLYDSDHPIFLTWRLHNRLPPNRSFSKASLTNGEAFVAMDRLLEETRGGLFLLAQPAIAGMVVEAIHFNPAVLPHYELHAFAVMPNHVHVLITPSSHYPNLPYR